jgi:hypothetical protein
MIKLQTLNLDSVRLLSEQEITNKGIITELFKIGVSKNNLKKLPIFLLMSVDDIYTFDPSNKIHSTIKTLLGIEEVKSEE